MFVVQHHAASHLHFDLRLELDGTLKSWSVPKGPSLNPEDKRFAHETEDHPLDYARFEGIIPPGNYGAGAAIVWDRGRCVFIAGEKHGIEHGKLLFDLYGHKLRGRWTLVKTKRGDKEWLLIKKPDVWADPKGERPPPPQSIFSNLTVEELRDGRALGDELREEADRLRAPERALKLTELRPMLAQPSEGPFSKKGWLFEIKHDGFRVLASRRGNESRLQFRSGRDATHMFPEIAEAVGRLAADGVVVDGEAVVLDPAGRSSFQLLQQRGHLVDRREIARATVSLPALYIVFDLLAVEGRDLRALPLLERKALLRRLVPPAGPLRFSEHLEERGEDMFREVQRLGLEGLVAKKADSPYRSGRFPSWLKVTTGHRGDFVVVGFTAPEGNRIGFGALHLAFKDEADFRYAGSVGTGFSDAMLKSLHASLEPLRRRTPPCVGEIPPGRGNFWIDPKRVCEVRYKQWPEGGLLRAPVFVAMRDDKTPDECVLPSLKPEAEEAPTPAPKASGNRVVKFSRLDKVFWPNEGYTKGDLIEFYRAVSPWLLPYLQDRALMLTRYPDGITGKSFFQKDAPKGVPDWLRRERVWSDERGEELQQFVCDDVESLLYLVNLGTIPLHIEAARVSHRGTPDWCIVDLDPKGAPFSHVVQLALAVRELCEELDLPSFVKTSGGSGLHVLIPLGGALTHDQSTALAELLARVIAEEHPKISTVERVVEARGGRVYLDYLQNGHGKLLASPFCVRPLPGATVSTPLAWREVNRKLSPAQFTLKTVPARMKRLKEDPLREVLTLRPNVPAALEKLARRLRRGD